jgi:polyisoprenoid-binding protein YceI
METKLMPMHAACKVRALGIVALAIVGGCATRAPPQRDALGTHAPTPSAVGQTYRLVSSESLLIVRVYRGGALARAGHNHIVASHDLAGSIQVAADVARSSCELSFPVAALTVDEAELRASQGPDFAADVPESAREGTRHNMLGPAVLNADAYPLITMKCASFEPDGEHLVVHLKIQVRAHQSEFTVPVSYTLSASELLAQGELSLRQTDLGLAPFTALLGALAVQDEMHLQFHIVARTS